MTESNKCERSERPRITRRQAIAMGGLSTVGFLTGCVGNDGDDETPAADSDDGNGDDGTGDSDTTTTEEPEEEGNPFIEGQEFRRPLDEDPADTTFFEFGNWDSYHESPLEPNAPGEMSEPSIWGTYQIGAFLPEPDREGGRLYEDWTLDLENGLAEIKIREDAKWSDGTDVTARDVAAHAGIIRLAEQEDEDEETSFFAEPGTASFRFSWDYLEFPDGEDGKTLQFRSDRGAMAHFTEPDVLGSLQRHVHMGIKGPAHVEPIKSMADAVLEDLEYAYENPKDTDNWRTREELVLEYVTEETLNEWRDPEKVLSFSAWQLEDVRGSQEIVLTPNPHYQNADQVNFSKVVNEFAPESQRQHALLQSGELDAGSVQMSQSAVDSLPDKYELKTYGGSASNAEVGFDQNHFAFKHHEVRQAIAYAIDSEAIAGNVHPSATRPFNRFPGEVTDRDFVATDEWVEENLIDYSQDQDKADSLMQEAGFERNSDGIWEKDGDELSVSLHSYQEDPIFENTLVDQLSRWGMDTNLQLHDESTYNDRWKAGEFDFFLCQRGGGFLTQTVEQVNSFWFNLLIHKDFADTWNIYDDEAVDEAVATYPDSGWVTNSWDSWEDLTIDLPPIGQPDGEKTPTAVSHYAFAGVQDPDVEMDEDYWKLLMWAVNYYIPAIPIYGLLNQVFINTVNFDWPTDEPMWDHFGSRAYVSDWLALGLIEGNIDNPKDGAEVVER